MSQPKSSSADPADSRGPESTNSHLITLSEQASKLLLTQYGIPFLPEITANSGPDAVDAARSMGMSYPVVAKLNGETIAHKTERGLVKLGLSTPEALSIAVEELLGAARPEDGVVSVLVAPMVKSNREFICGCATDPQFGPTVLLGVGGVLTEAIADVSIRLCPITAVDANEMIDDLRTQLLIGPFRGEPAIDREALADLLVGLSDSLMAEPRIRSIDLNPVLIVEGRPVAVDALVETANLEAAKVEPADPDNTVQTRSSELSKPISAELFNALFNPRGVVIAGASTHPGKFGFVSLHNLLTSGYQGKVFATNRDGSEVLGVKCVRSIDDLPDGEIDLVFVCTPKEANVGVLRACAAKGIRAAFVTSAGYGESGPEGIAAQAELVAVAAEEGILLAGPNGQGVVSTPSQLCAQIVAPYPPAGSIGVASQSGNFVSSFLNWSTQTGVGISRAVSAGNAAATTVPDFLEFYCSDPATSVGLSYVEGISDGAAFYQRMRRVAQTKPLVLVKGGATAGGAKAAASHTGSLASDDRVFDGAMRQAGVIRASTVEEGFEAAATFATQPVPTGNRVVVLTTAGGWGVVTADAIHESDLELLTLPSDLLEAINTKLPPRWSRSNPVDLAGGETRDTIPEVLRLVASHPEVDAIIYLGLGIQSNQAKMMRDSGFYPDHGLERIVNYHQRQDRRFAQAAADISMETGKPILAATELATTDPANPGPATVRETGRLCYASANRAVTALEHLWHYRQFQLRRSASSFD